MLTRGYIHFLVVQEGAVEGRATAEGETIETNNTQ